MRTLVGSVNTNLLPAVSKDGVSTAAARARCATTKVPAFRSTVVDGCPLSTAGTGHCTLSSVTWALLSTTGYGGALVLDLSAIAAVPVPIEPMTAAPASGRAPTETVSE